MIVPFSSSVAREVLRAVPQAQREGAYALGATRWEAIRMALFYARTGIVGVDHARLRPRARRDDGGDDGDRQHAAGVAVAVRAAVHDGGRDRQRVRRSRPTSCTSMRWSRSAWCCSSSRSASTSISRAFIWSLGAAGPARPARAAGRRRRRPDADALAPKLMSHPWSLLCGAAVLLALVPLALILFYVDQAGRLVDELGLLHAHAGAGR